MSFLSILADHCTRKRRPYPECSWKFSINPLWPLFFQQSLADPPLCLFSAFCIQYYILQLLLVPMRPVSLFFTAPMAQCYQICRVD